MAPRIRAWIAALAALALLGGCGSRFAKIRPPDLSDEPRKLAVEYGIKRLQLANGLQVILLPDDTTNLVEVSVSYAVGAVEDPPGKAGLAHMVEHVSFEIGPERPRLSDRLAAVALNHNAHTTWDETLYRSIALSDRLPELLAVEAARMGATCEQLDPEVFEREREVIRNEIRERSAVGAALEAMLRNEIYGDEHVYARPVGGSDEAVASLGLADVCRFLADYYAPERAVLVVAGKITVADAEREVERAFGELLPVRTPARAPVAPAELSGARSVHRVPVTRATVFVVSPAPVFSDREAVYDELLRELFESTLLARMLERDYVAWVSIAQMGGTRAPLDVAAVTLSDPDKANEAIEAFFEVRARFLEELSYFDIRPQRSRGTAALVEAIESIRGRARMFARYAQYGGSGLSLRATIGWLQRATLGQLRGRFDNFFHPDRVHIATFVPDPDEDPIQERVDIRADDTSYDIGDWQTPVDPNELDRSLEVPDTPRVEVRSFELSNGLRVLMAPSLPYPLIDIRVVFPVGSLHDPPGAQGLARAAALLLDKDLTKPFQRRDEAAIVEILEMGGSMSTHVTETTTTFRTTGLSIYADGLLWELHWLLESGRYSAKLLELVKNVIDRNRDPEARAAERRVRAVRRALFGDGHPYAAPSSGAELFETIAVADLRAFRRDHYAIRGATIVIAGQFDADDMKRRVETLFGAWPGDRAVSEAPRMPAVTPRSRARHLAYVDDGAAQVRVALAFPTAPGYDDRRGARAVMREMLRLRMEALRERFGSTYGIHVWQTFRSGPGDLVITGAIDAARAGQGLVAMREILDQLREGHGLEDVFVRARRLRLERLLAESAEASTVASELEHVALGRLPVGGYKAIARDVATVRLADVLELAREELAPERAVVLLAGDGAAVEAAYEAAGIEDVEQLE